jgi:hypothetical protein
MPPHVQRIIEENCGGAGGSVTNMLSAVNTDRSCNGIVDKENYLI